MSAALLLGELVRVDPLSRCTRAHLPAREREVRAVDLVDTFDRLRTVRPHTLVVIHADAASGGWSLAAALHIAWERNVTGVVFTGGAVGPSTVLLAQRLDIALFHGDLDPVDLALTMAGTISAPQSARALRIAGCAEQLAGQHTFRGILAVLGKELAPAPVALLAGTTVLAGRAAAAAARPEQQSVRVPVPTAAGHVVAELVCAVPPGGDVGTAEALLSLARPAVLAAWAQLRLQPAARSALERASFRLLRETVEPAPALRPAAAGEQPASWPAELGWQVAGTNRAVWIAAADGGGRATPGDPDGELSPVVHAIWQEHLPQWPLAPDDDGWVSWLNGAADRPAVVRRALRTATAALQRHGLVVGVGTPHPDTAGLVRSTAEARLAARVARLAGPGAVQWFDGIGLRAALAWIPADDLEEIAALCLPELVAARDRAALVATVLAVLDAGGSLAQAASRLGVHRNTVLGRLTRARELGLRPDDPDERLALHLVVHALDARWAEPPGPT